MSDQIVLIGASVRAAAQSAIRGGFAPWCADLFADSDLTAIASAQRIRHYPAGLVAALADAPVAPVVYTGALENYPRLIDAIAIRRPLWGNRGEVLRAIRDPFYVSDVLRGVGLSALEVRRHAPGLPRDGTWLCKPIRSGGGWRITTWVEGTIDPNSSELGGRSGRSRGGYYFQRRVEGLNCSALYVAAKREARLLGVTRQLVGTIWTGGGPFSYAGSIGPHVLPPAQYSIMRQIGECLAAEFQLVGLFGVDAIINDDGVWPLEVNPRYPASAEVLERACGFSAIQLHAMACSGDRLPGEAPPPASCSAGKAVLFATTKTCVSEQLLDWANEQNAGAIYPAVADIPHMQSLVPAGAPVLTVLADGVDELQVERLLCEKTASARSRMR